MFRWMIVFGRRPRHGKMNDNPGPSPSEVPEPDTVKASIEARQRKLTIVSDRLHERRQTRAARP